MSAKSTPAPLAFPRLSVIDWIVLGVDLSFSRTGIATLHLEGGDARWGRIESIAPKSAQDETWARGTAIANHLRGRLRDLMTTADLATRQGRATGVILALETPDPNNSYLMALNGIVQSILWKSEEGHPAYPATPLYRLLINASTLRAALRLPGTKTDKDENKALAQQYLPPGDYPGLDSDSCDAVLLAMMGKHAGMILIGQEDMVPTKPLHVLCSEEVKVKVTTRKGISYRTETPKALMHNPATWTSIPPQFVIQAGISDASTTARSVLTQCHL